MAEHHREHLPSRIQHRLDAQILLAERRKKSDKVEAVQPAPFITVARQYGCEAMALAELLSERLPNGPWPVYSRQIFEKMAEEGPISERLLNSLDVHARTGIEEFFQNLLGRSPTDLRVLHQLVRTVRGLGLLGHCIIVGRGASALTAGLSGGIHIRLIAPRAWREKSLTERFNWSPEQVRSVLDEEEHGRHSFFRKYLGQDPDNPELYDLVLNTARLTRDEQTAAVQALYLTRFAR